MSVLFEPGRINGLNIPNRFVRSATWEGLANEAGACTPQLITLVGRLAEGGVGLIITGHAYVRKEGQVSFRQLGVHEDLLIPGLSQITHEVHGKGGRIVLQLAHAGICASPELSGMQPAALSPLTELASIRPQLLTAGEIRELVQDFGRAARRAKEARFDGVQIHAAHGYLLSQSLSPAYNQRKDEYGGSVDNRARFLLEVVEAVRGAVGAEFPVLVKMNSQDFREDGLTLEESVRIGIMLERAGIDAIELSGGAGTVEKLGSIRRGVRREDQEAYFREGAVAFKQAVKVPIILVGGIRSFSVAEKLLEEGTADHVSMSRPFIREPGLVRRWESGDRRKAACLSDNLCFGPARSGEGIYCVVDAREKRKKSE